MATKAPATVEESVRLLRWTLDVWLPQQMAATTHARRLTSLRRQRDEATAELARLTEPTKDQSYCDLGQHQQCSGYTEDEADPETCMCNCHDLPFTTPTESD